MKIFAFALLTAALATPALAGENPSAAARPKKERLICKRIDRTSSHMAERVCRTAKDWAGTSIDHDQDSLEMINNGAKTGCTGALGGGGAGRR